MTESLPSSRKTGRWPRRVRFGLVALPAGAALLLVASRFPAVVERVYAAGVYPLLASLLSRISGPVPFSLTDIAFVALIALLLGSPIKGFLAVRRGGGGLPDATIAAVARVAGELGWIWALFLVLFGFNYAREQPEPLFGLERSLEPGAREELIVQIGTRVDALRRVLDEGPDGVAVVPGLSRELDRRLRALQVELLRDEGLPVVTSGRVKRLAISPLLLRWGVSGVYGPLTGEPNIVFPAPPVETPFVIAHERAHLSGFAWEEAASFVALRTLWRADAPELQYSGWLSLWMQLRRGTKGRAPGVQRDVEAIRRFIRSHRGQESRSMHRIYDAYLRVHGVSGGSQSYGRVAGLALRYLAEGGMPPLPLQVEEDGDGDAAGNVTRAPPEDRPPIPAPPSAAD